MTAASLTPRVRMMTLCDGVRESRAESDVYHLKAVRQRMTADRFPFAPARLRLFLLLSCPRAGEYPCYVRIINDRSDRTVFYTYLRPTPTFETDSDLLAYAIPIRCSFADAERYMVQVWFFQEQRADVLKGEIPFSIFSEGGNP